VRDNNPDYGGAVWEEVAFKADGNAGPFRVLAPNTSNVNWKVGEYQQVAWDVSNTDNNRVKCYYVDIKLSVDGGFTYPYTLLEGTPNDGSAFITVPDALSNEARVRVEASNNIFFDISDANFFIEEATEPGYTFNLNPVAVPLYCHPGEPISIDVNTGSVLGYDSTLALNLLGELPASAVVNFEDDMLTAGESTTLTIEIPAFVGRDTFDLQVQASTPGQATSLRELRIIVLSNDFSGLALNTPVNGETDVLFSTDFDWTPIDNAYAYNIQIATSPSFEQSTIFEAAYGITETEYTPEAILDENTIYYWRVRPINDCGPGDYLTPFAFQTTTVDCNTNIPQDLPIALPNNLVVRTSKIFVPTGGVISDLNLANVEIFYQPINSLQIKLVSPAGTEAILFDQNCLNTGTIKVDFDDEAPTELQCPPINGNPFKPETPLSVFDGEDTFGDWELQVRIVTSGFGGGSINSWDLEFCASVSLAPPTLIRNEPLAVPPGQGNTITKDLLEVQDENSAPAGIWYRLLSIPAHGELYRAGDNEPLTPGEIFTQETVNAFNLSYVHDGSDTQQDQFDFIVTNEAGGWIPGQVFNIEIDENAVVSTEGQQLENTLTVFPNPARSEVNLQLLAPAQGRMNVKLMNLHGQLLQTVRFPEGDRQLTVPVNNLQPGVYFIALEGESGKVTRKLIVQ